MTHYHSIAEAAEILEISTKTIRRRIADGSLRATRPRNTRRILIADPELRRFAEAEAGSRVDANVHPIERGSA